MRKIELENLLVIESLAGMKPAPGAEMRKYRSKFTEKQMLVSLLLQAIRDAERRHRRVPTKEEILDELFSPARGDPEAVSLERKIAPLLTDLIDDLEAVKTWAEEIS